MSDLYDAETKGGRLYSVGETDENPASGLNSEDGDGIIKTNNPNVTNKNTNPNKTKTSALHTNVARYIPYQKLGRDNVSYIKRRLISLYSGILNGVADGIAISRGNNVFIVDSGKEYGEISFGVRRVRKISNPQILEEFIRSTNNDTVSKGYVSNELLEKFEYGIGGDFGRDLRRKLGGELQGDIREPQNNQSGVSKNDENQRGIINDRDYSSYDTDIITPELDRAYLDAVNR